MQVAQSNTYLLFIKTLCLSMAFPLRGRGTTGCKCLVGQSNTSFLHAWLGTTAFKMLLILQLSFLLFISGFLNCSRDRLPAVNFMVLIKYVVCFFIIKELAKNCFDKRYLKKKKNLVFQFQN